MIICSFLSENDHGIWITGAYFCFTYLRYARYFACLGKNDCLLVHKTFRPLFFNVLF